MIYRRFGFLHARLLLQKQDELRLVEEELDEIDQRDACGKDAMVLQCREDDEARTGQEGNTRKSLLSRIEDTLLKYGKSRYYAFSNFTNQLDNILFHAQQLVLSNRPSERDYNSLKNFMWNKKPLLEGNAQFIYNKDDLVTLRSGRNCLARRRC